MATDPHLTHVLAEVGDKRTLCGIKRDQGPTVLARFVGVHARGHPDTFTVCDDCAAQAADHNINLDGGHDAP